MAGLQTSPEQTEMARGAVGLNQPLRSSVTAYSRRPLSEPVDLRVERKPSRARNEMRSRPGWRAI